MKKIIISTILIFAFAISAQAFNSDELNHVEFVNQTGDSIIYLFLSPSDSGYWGPDILGSSRTLSDGDSLGFYLHYPETCNEFDIMGIDSNDDAFILWNYEVCDDRSERIVISSGDFTDSPPDMEYVYLEITNTTPYDMYYIFVSPSDSSYWGADLLDESTILYEGETLSILVPSESSGFEYDFLGVDEDMDEYRKTINVGTSDVYEDITMSDYISQ